MYVESKEKIKQNRKRLIVTENRLLAAGGEGGWGLGEKGEGVNNYKLVVTESSQGCKLKHRRI